jgi:hypothetical protein
MVIVRELRKWEEFIPVVLALTDKETDVLLQFLVQAFRLAIRLRVIGSGR